MDSSIAAQCQNPTIVNQNLRDHMEMVATLDAAGFKYDMTQVAEAERKSGAFKGCAEYVFKR